MFANAIPSPSCVNPRGTGQRKPRLTTRARPSMEYGVWFALDVGHREQQHPYRTPELGVPAVGGPAKEDRIGLAAVGATTVLVTLRMSDEHTCTAWNPWRRRPPPAACAFRSTPRPRWQCGGRCTSDPKSPRHRACRANPPSGSAAPTWCVGWATAPPAMHRATRWAPRSKTTDWPVARCRCSPGSRPTWHRGPTCLGPGKNRTWWTCCAPVCPPMPRPAGPWPR